MERAALIELVRATGCAVEHGNFIFLCDPRWGPNERSQLAAVIERVEPGDLSSDHGWLGVATGGTSGGVRFARHDERTLTAAARGFAAHFGVTQVNAVDVLPPFHVSGLLARVRCAETGGRHLAWNWKQLETGHRPEIREGMWTISLVPTQLQRLLADSSSIEWLKKFALILLGGGPVWPTLAEAAARAELPIVLSYGMTETAAMVTALRPEEFAAGRRDSGTALPHAQIFLSPSGTVSIAGESVFHGYFPDRSDRRSFETQDLGELAADGHLRVLGRRDAVIISGGEKINPSEVEAVLRDCGEFADVAVIGVPDPVWGEIVVACYPVASQAPDLVKVAAFAAERLAGFKRPKRFVACTEWPRNGQGKINRPQLLRQANVPS